MTRNWTKWIDISVFTFAYSTYILQGKYSKKTNRKKFRVTKCSSYRIDAFTTTERQLIDSKLFNPAKEN